MLPLHQAKEIRDSLRAYLRSTFDFRDPVIRSAFEAFVNDPEDGLFKGTYVSLKLPFVKASQKDLEAIPLEVKPDWLPYKHQVDSWQRLSTEGKTPEPTLVTTGTGSGKTESFLYPVLDYCRKQQGIQGVKCIILYPMNALATDQAQRLAEVIHADKRLRGNITAGLFIGDSNSNRLPTLMDENHIIERRDAIVADPPDILLTNFKMLDYGLMRQEYHRLWAGNFDRPELLKFLVLDEMHTYDGAQGTDVANLIRRLKLKLDIPPGQICPVGTSATLGSGEGAKGELARYASEVFGEAVSEDAVIGESRVTSEDFFGDRFAMSNFVPRPGFLQKQSVRQQVNHDDLVRGYATACNLDEDNLADGLRELQLVRDLVDACNRPPGIFTIPELVHDLTEVNPEFKKRILEEDYPQKAAELLVSTFLALIGSAKENDSWRSPMLFLQTQLWIRELSGVRLKVSESPEFQWRDREVELGTPKRLPPWFCRECGTTGWLASKPDHREQLDTGDGDGTNKFFSHHKNTFLVLPSSVLSRREAAESGFDTRDSFEAWVQPETLELFEDGGDGRLRIFGARKLDANGKSEHICPSCGGRNAISLIGTRVSTMTSVAVSQTLASDFDDSPEQQRKVLAFTNSVQDAAHQAGFIEARNYRFTMRASIQRVLNEFPGEQFTLPGFQACFKDFWKQYSDDSGKGNIEAYYHRFFPKDYIGRADPSDYKKGNNYIDLFETAFDERIDWEVMNEWGFESLLGRTLEKTACAGVSWDVAALEQTAEQLFAWYEKNQGPAPFSVASLQAFVALIAHRMRTRGAIDHPLLHRYREGRFERGDLNWYGTKVHILHRWFGARTRLPRMVITSPQVSGTADTTHSGKSVSQGVVNWFHVYYRKSFDEELVNLQPGFINEFFECMLQSGTASGLFHRAGSEGSYNYALHPAALKVGKGVEDFRCSKCGHEVHEARHEGKPSIVGGACLIYRCQGKYERLEAEREADYYQMVYNRDRTPRVYSRDHTGLLDRKDREILERDFKQRPRFNSPNALVATSTLEMGIDIGSLQVAYNTSIPPTPSNFLQRVGRAGRKSGTALVLNFATGKSHDQYHFKAPLGMMAGEVNAPGCFLNAREILRRHFFAFCIDSWTVADPSAHKIPATIRQLKLLKSDLQAPGFFMNNILAFVADNRDSLIERFNSLFSRDVEQGTLDELRTWIEQNNFHQFYSQIFLNLQKEMQGIQAHRLAVLKRIEKEQLGESDILHAELKREAGALWSMLKTIEQRLVLEHLTNSGGLPNYAFPETGVTLNARVFRQVGAEAVANPIHKEYVIVRSASQALRELAPGSVFYSQGHRLEIAGLNVVDLAGQGERMVRFCSSCDHLEETARPITDSPCPKCGDESWMANSNLHRFTKLTSVRSVSSSSKSRVSDKYEVRKNQQFAISRHFDFKRSAGAFALPHVSFGIEFVREVRVVEMNLGYENSPHVNRLEINGQNVPTHGFITCRHCGKSTARTQKDATDYHYKYCAHQHQAWTEQSSGVFAELFLQREVTTEALKILLPVQDFAEEGDVELFQAGLELGFRKFFKGNPQHLAIRQYNEFNPSTGKKDRYLVVLDQVPGGTGYLQQLFAPEQLGALLKVAYEGLASCSCQFEGRDGCYHCVYSYGNQAAHVSLSRAKGQALLGQIIDRLDNWEWLPEGLDQVTLNGRVEESELERRFVRALRSQAQREPQWTFEEENFDGKVRYVVRIGDGLVWRIDPQVDLGRQRNVKESQRPDFLMSVLRYEVNGEDLREEIPDMAVYLDGFQFHASAVNRRLAADLRKREHLREHPEFHVWTLTWEDLNRFEAGVSDQHDAESSDALHEAFVAPPYSQHAERLLQAVRRAHPPQWKWRNSVERLLGWMESPRLQEAQRQQWSLFLAAFQPQLFQRVYPALNEAQALRDYFDGGGRAEKPSLDCWVPLQLPGRLSEMAELRAVVNLARSEVSSQMRLMELEAVDKAEWNQFWSLYNILQFFPLTQVQQIEIQPAEGQFESSNFSRPDEQLSQEDLNSILELYDPQFHEAIRNLWQAGGLKHPDDEIGLNVLCDSNGDELALADFIDSVGKVAYNPAEQSQVQVFEAQGYKVVITDSFEQQ